MVTCILANMKMMSRMDLGLSSGKMEATFVDSGKTENVMVLAFSQMEQFHAIQATTATGITTRWMDTEF